MADEVQYQPNWAQESTQCKNCKFFKTQAEQNACVPEGMTFNQALEKFGELPPDGHCNFFTANK